MSSTMMMVRVRLALRWVGSRKALTPLETASTPVMAVQPLAKTLSSSQRESIDAADGQVRRSDDRDGMAVGENRANGSDDDDEEQRADEEVGGDEEGRAGVLGAAHVDEGEDGEDEQAEGERVWLELGEGGDQRADACGDADGGVQDVVDHERGGGEKAGGFAEVLCGDGIAAAAVGIGVDRLAVGEVDDGQKADDGEADGDDVRDAGQAERDEQGERGFGAIGGGAERVQAEDRDAGDGPDVLGALFGGGERLAEKDIEKGHKSPAALLKATLKF